MNSRNFSYINAKDLIILLQHIKIIFNTLALDNFLGVFSKAFDTTLKKNMLLNSLQVFGAKGRNFCLINGKAFISYYFNIHYFLRETGFSGMVTLNTEFRSTLKIRFRVDCSKKETF